MLGVAQVLQLVVEGLLAGGEVVGLGLSEVAANDACCIWVLKQSSPTTPPSSTRLTRVTNGIRAARTRRRGYDGQPGPGDARPRRAAARRSRSWRAGVLMLLLPWWA